MPKKIDAPGPFALRTPLILQLNTVLVNRPYRQTPVNIGFFENEETLPHDVGAGYVSNRNTGCNSRRRKHKFLHSVFPFEDGSSSGFGSPKEVLTP